ncbi:MAG: NAD(P)/FAD-dependent oxidoreductase [Acidimicrobiia bacterium]|nr:NAD(P)/FAD-dependent oxidoreductase [Acidimicrobiia bacterium]
MTSDVDEQTQARPAVVVIGAGPAGLTAAYELGKAGHASTILEADDIVGGISRTVERDGWRFDIGGHRFFTKVKPVDDLWFEILGADEFLSRPRMSRIFYKGKLYDYPLVPMNALRNLGPVEAVRCVLSYLWVRVRPPKNRHTLEGFIVSRFGWRLYQHFFKTYNEKVWGVPPSEISADWGAQRIKNLSLMRAATEALTPRWIRARRGREKQVTSLIEEFNYPKYGPGQMWEKAAEIVTGQGSTLLMQSPVVGVHHSSGLAHSVTARVEGEERTFGCTDVVSSMPFGQLIEAMDPPAPAEVLRAARALAHRDFITVALVVPEEFSFPDNWIYIHDPGVEVGRIQNFGSWSPYLVKDGRTCLGLEFFVNEGDSTWTKSDDELIAQATREVTQLGLVEAGKVEAGYVVRIPKAYPVYDDAYQVNVEVLRAWIAENVPNVFPVGRNGMHKYNNQDHSMLTAMLSVENIMGAHHDVWAVNVEAEYHEEHGDPTGGGGGGTGRDAPILPRTGAD